MLLSTERLAPTALLTAPQEQLAPPCLLERLPKLNALSRLRTEARSSVVRSASLPSPTRVTLQSRSRARQSREPASAHTTMAQDPAQDPDLHPRPDLAPAPPH